MAVIAGLMDDEIWDVETLLKQLDCYTCNTEMYNTWQVCLRRSSSTNLHPEFTSRERQCWFISINTAKYFVVPAEYDGPIFDFNGLFFPQQRPMILSNSTLPAKQRQSVLYSYGKFLLMCISIGESPLQYFLQEMNFWWTNGAWTGAPVFY